MIRKENYFSQYKDGDLKLGWRAMHRKVGHGARDAFKVATKADMATAGVSTGANAATMMNTSASVAAIAGSSAKAVVAITSPIFGLASGLVTLGLLAYDTYSDREKRHLHMAKYLPSLIDSNLPEENFFTTNNQKVIEKVCADALYLLKEGPNQYQRMAGKFQLAYKKFVDFYTRNLITPKKEWAPQPIDDGEKEMFRSRWIESASRRDEVVWEYLRRLIHTGNYLQCGAVINHATFKKLGVKDDIGWQVEKDPLRQIPWAREVRKEMDIVSNGLKVYLDLE